MRHVLTVIAFLGVALGVPAREPAYAQQGVTEAWIQIYGFGHHPEFAFARAIAVDGTGNVHVTGSSYAPNGLPDYATIKYSAAGDTLWVKRYNGPDDNWDAAWDLALDASGNVYVTGVSNGSNSFDYVTIKYDAAGNEQWVARYDGPANSEDWANALALDSSGNVYVTGYSAGVGTAEDYATVKYAPSGAQEWVARYNGPGNTRDRAQDVAVDGSGSVFVTGDSGEGSINQSDYVTVKYSPAGAEQWVGRYTNGFDYATALVVDAAGNVTVTGYSYGSGTFYDYATVSYATNGDPRWLDRYHGGVGDDFGHSLAVDAAGNVYVTGESVGAGTGGDYATLKYGPTGARLWVARYDGPHPSTGGDVANAVAVDPSGNVYVTGESGDLGTETDYATVKYNSAGAEQWVARYNLDATSFDQAEALAVDASGSVYVTGSNAYSGGGGRVWATIKYNSPLDDGSPRSSSQDRR